MEPPRMSGALRQPGTGPAQGPGGACAGGATTAGAVPRGRPLCLVGRVLCPWRLGRLTVSGRWPVVSALLAHVASALLPRGVRSAAQPAWSVGPGRKNHRGRRRGGTGARGCRAGPARPVPVARGGLAGGLPGGPLSQHAPAVESFSGAYVPRACAR